MKGTIEFLTKGCSCKKGCKTKQCGCRKTGRHCGPGCDCHGCTNLFEGTESDPDDKSDAEGEETGQEDQNSQCSSGSEDEKESIV